MKVIFTCLVFVIFTGQYAINALVHSPTELPANQQVFWQRLQKICGNTYSGTLVTSLANDTTFTNKPLLIYIKACSNERIRIPLVVGNDRSRT